MAKPRIEWYRSPVPRERLRELTRREDLRGLVQALAFLFIYLATTAVALYFFLNRLWILIYTVNFSYFFATFLVHSCEIQQHSGLSHNVPDWRLNAYTVKFGPVMRFLYWNMNYHVEHHMYAAVPFYNLPKLSKELAADLARPLKGYFGGLAHVIRLKRRQKTDPDFRYVPEFPDTATRPKTA